ncbi:MAG: glycosyltransferase family 2 protein [Acidiferrobacterales bacterium]
MRMRNPDVIHLVGEPTLWWTGATNLGVRWAIDNGAEMIMLLNNDCYVTPDTIGRLVEHTEQAGEAIIAPIQKDYDTKQDLYDTASECFLLGFTTLIPPKMKTESNHGDTVRRTKLIIGGRGVLIPIRVFERIGLFDDVNLPHYGADHDFYMRARKQGIPLLSALDAVVYIDNRRTTLARRLGTLSFSEFRMTLTSPQSHRNVRDLTALFKKHYPIRGLHHVGVALNLMRYAIVYAYKRMTHLLRLS